MTGALCRSCGWSRQLPPAPSTLADAQRSRAARLVLADVVCAHLVDEPHHELVWPEEIDGPPLSEAEAAAAAGFRAGWEARSSALSKLRAALESAIADELPGVRR